MKEGIGDLWNYHSKGEVIVITTNGNINIHGELIMGKGIALQAKQRFPRLPEELGKAVWELGNSVFILPSFRLISFPTKNNWWEKSDLSLIETSTKELLDLTNSCSLKRVYMPRPGCSNGGLDWKIVKSILQAILDDRFTAVSLKEES